MTDQPQSWAERTVEMPPEQGNFRRGVASVGVPKPAAAQTFSEPAQQYPPTGTGWPDAGLAPRRPLEYHLRQWRRGAGWSLIGGLFAFICWGIWAISTGGDLTSPVVTFVLSLFVAAGIFALARLIGLVVLERQFGRTRRGARGAHVVTGLFLVGVGVAYLRQTEWVMDFWGWLTSF